MRRKLGDVAALCTGGLIATTRLRTLAEAALSIGCGKIRIGYRQEAILPEVDAELLAARYPGLDLEAAPACYDRNTASTAPAAGLEPSSSWVQESDFLEVFDQIPPNAARSIAVADPAQRHLPIYNGEILLLASPIPRYWRVGLHAGGIVRRSSWAIPQQHAGKALVYVLDHLSSGVEGLLAAVGEQLDDAAVPVDDGHEPPQRFISPLTGLHRMANDAGYWLGIAGREGEFEARFLLDLCLLAQKSELSTIGLTPYRTLIARNIAAGDTARWRLLLARHGMRPTPDDDGLGWITSDSPSALALKTRLLAALRKSCALQAGCTVSLLAPRSAGEAVIHIEREGTWQRRPFARYTVSVRPHFDWREPNTRVAARSLSERELAAQLLRLFRERALGDAHAELEDNATPRRAEVQVHICAHCETVYDSRYGDPGRGTAPGTQFDELPAGWSCPVCEAPQSDFRLHTPSHEVLGGSVR